VTPRVKNPTLVGKPFTLHKLTSGSKTHEEAEQDSSGERPERKNEHPGKKQNQQRRLETSKQEFDGVLESLNTFNHDISHLGPQLTKEQEQSKVYLFGTLDTVTLPPDLKQTLSRYANVFAIADSMAIYFQDRTVKTLVFLFSLFFIAVACFNVFTALGVDLVASYGDVWGERLKFLFLLFYLILLVCAYYIWYWRATRGHYQSKYLDYRALAEGVRVQFFWSLAGIVDSVALHYLRKQKSELDWIRNSMRVANLLCDVQSQGRPAAFSGASLDDRYRMLLKNWVDDQETYFTRASARQQRKLEEHERWVQRLFITGMGLAVLVFLLQGLLIVSLYPEWISTIPIVDLLLFLMSLALVFAALRDTYTTRMAYSEQIKQYQRMSYLFRLASQHLKAALKAGRPQEAEHVIRELGKEALEENGDWVLLHRTRPISVPR
jgi:hypothetical protein